VDANPDNEHRANVQAQRHTPRAEPSRLLVAFDDSADAHRLVRLCCEHAGDEQLTVSLLVGTDASSSESSAAERLLRHSAGLLEAAGVDVEDVLLVGDGGRGITQLVRAGGFDAVVLCSARGSRAPIPSLVGRQARRRGLRVFESRHPVTGAEQPSWVQRVVDPFHLWQRVWERVG
jgi:nucleotide-binding universal stress UspA family protein